MSITTLDLPDCHRQSHNAGGFLPAVKQIGNVAALRGTEGLESCEQRPGIVKHSIGLPAGHLRIIGLLQI